MKKPFEPNFKTPVADFSRPEIVKGNPIFVLREMSIQFKEEQAHVSSDVETYAKSFGIYLEFNRAKPGRSLNRDWMYMIRISNPGGGPINREQWQTFDELANKYTTSPEGHPSLRLTTRQNIQFHWIKKPALKEIIKMLAEKDLLSINGCGDNTRNVMACPLSRYSDIFNANQWAQKAGKYFQLPLEPFIKVFEIDPEYIRTPGETFQYGPRLLNRKFKIGFSTIHHDPETGKLVPDNCIEVLTNDLAIVPIIDGDKVSAFQIYLGGGQGERNNHPTMAALAKPFCIIAENKLIPVLDAIVKVHQEWGDRENRYWARLKYVVKKKGLEWYRKQVTDLIDFPMEKPNPDLDCGDRHMHFGWNKQPTNGLWAYGAYIENGRLIDNSPNGKLKSMVRGVMDKYDIELMVTPNQDILFMNIPDELKKDFENDLKSYGYGLRNGKPYSKLRTLSGACVGRDTCRLTMTDSEKFEPELLDELEKMGWGAMAESIGITGCERQCFRPATKSIGLVGSGLNRYQFKLFGDETARHQGTPLISSNGEEMYLRTVIRDQVVIVIDALFKFYQANKQNGEGLGAYHRRIGADAIIAHLKENPATSALMAKPWNTDCVID